jgi:hypothetical protein
MADNSKIGFSDFFDKADIYKGLSDLSVKLSETVGNLKVQVKDTATTLSGMKVTNGPELKEMNQLISESTNLLKIYSQTKKEESSVNKELGVTEAELIKQYREIAIARKNVPLGTDEHVRLTKVMQEMGITLDNLTKQTKAEIQSLGGANAAALTAAASKIRLRQEIKNLTLEQQKAVKGTEEEIAASKKLTDAKATLGVINKQESSAVKNRMAEILGEKKAFDQETASIREVKDEIKRLSMINLAGKTTEEIKKIQTQIGTLKNDAAETSAYFKALDKNEIFNNMTAGIRGAVAAVQVFGGALKVFGVESELARKLEADMMALIGVTQALGVLQDLKDKRQLAALATQVKGISQNLTEILTIKAKTVATVENTTAEVTANAVKETGASATKKITALQWLWNAAVAANPIVAIIVAVAALAVGIYALTKAMTAQTQAEKIAALNKKALQDVNSEALKQTGETIAKLLIYQKTANDTTKTEQQRKDALIDIKTETKGVVDVTDLSTASLIKLNDALAKHIQILFDTAAADAAMKKAQESIAKYIELTTDKSKSELSNWEKIKSYTFGSLESMTIGTSNLTEVQNKMFEDSKNKQIELQQEQLNNANSFYNLSLQYQSKLSDLNANPLQRTGQTKDQLDRERLLHNASLKDKQKNARDEYEVYKKLRDSNIALMEDEWAKKGAIIMAGFEDEKHQLDKSLKTGELKNKEYQILLINADKQKQNDLKKLNEDYTLFLLEEYEKEIDAFEKSRKEQVDIAKEQRNKLKEIDQERENETLKRQEREHTRNVENAEKVKEAGSQFQDAVFEQIDAIQQKKIDAAQADIEREQVEIDRHQAEIDRLNELLKVEEDKAAKGTANNAIIVKNQIATEKALQEIDKQKQNAAREAMQKAFDQKKKADKAGATLDYLRELGSIASTAASMGFPFGVIYGILMAGVATLGYTKRIQAINSETLKLEKGGTVKLKGKRHSEGGIKIADNVEAEDGEMASVFSRAASQQHARDIIGFEEAANQNKLNQFYFNKSMGNVSITNDFKTLEVKLDKQINETRKTNELLSVMGDKYSPDGRTVYKPNGTIIHYV